MKPRFSTLTRIIAAVYVLAGAAACLAALHSGGRTTPGHGDGRLILSCISIAFLAIGVAMWAEAAWAGFAVAAFTVLMELILEPRDGGRIPWLGLLVLFVVSAAHARRDRLHERR